MIPQPYGGRLVNTLMSEVEAERRLEEASELPSLRPVVDHVYDADKIGVGAYSPLEGFMGEGEYLSVLNKNTLSNGLPWTMPIILTPRAGSDSQIVSEVRPSDTLVIRGLDDKPFALLELEEKFRFDKSSYSEKVYSTKDTAHPNVADLAEFGDVALAGKVRLIRRLSVPSMGFELTPQETREYFKRMGWESVAGYQARNPPHTAHEYIQRVTLEREDVDAIFIQPVVGKLKRGDYKPEVIMRAYEVFVKNYYPPNRVLLGSLSIAMRYAGPKASLFLAIVRRNYGCSHFIVGRDQAGVGSYYDPYACHRIFDEYDVGVVPLRYKETFYCRVCGWMASSKVCPHPEEYHESTSQTRIRKLLAEGKPLPTEILRPEVAEVLKSGDVINQ
ncbi:MAG: sulfate adenylyltransferase [Thermoprotei archaeon]